MNEEAVREAKRFVQAFVAPQKRRRYLTFLEQEKGRRKFLFELDHFRWLDRRVAEQVPVNEQAIHQIEARLAEHGAPHECFVITSDGSMGGRMALGDALDAIVGGGVGSVISIIPGKLAYYEAEEPFERYVCSARDDRR